MAIEIVSFPINSMVIFHSYVSLPEGNFIPWDITYNFKMFHVYHHLNYDLLYNL